mmetsp:Transcript_47963/g.71446  ORF Transcript_47963/g.71446 Transcript_47963/m.71446 type:complete len:113 (+) Transcript_47963:486-824(+)
MGNSLATAESLPWVIASRSRRFPRLPKTPTPPRSWRVLSSRTSQVTDNSLYSISPCQGALETNQAIDPKNYLVFTWPKRLPRDCQRHLGGKRTSPIRSKGVHSTDQTQRGPQ